VTHRFAEIQLHTGWGRTLATFAEWCAPQPGWRTVDVGCGPGLLPRLLAQRGCEAFGVDVDYAALDSGLWDGLALGEAGRLPFEEATFDLATAVNVLFLLPEPAQALREMRRVVKPGGRVCLLNPSEKMSVEAVTGLAEARGLQGLERESLVDWARRAEANRRWGEAELREMLAEAGLEMEACEARIGGGLARWVKGVR
jgi:ubiquinone/menaquinone biosynthesis C-methylase UbiE